MRPAQGQRDQGLWLRMSGDRCFPSAPLRVNSGERVLEAEEFNHLLSMTGSMGEGTPPQIATGGDALAMTIPSHA